MNNIYSIFFEYMEPVFTGQQYTGRKLINTIKMHRNTPHDVTDRGAQQHEIWHFLCDAEPHQWEFLGLLSEQLHVHHSDGTVSSVNHNNATEKPLQGQISKSGGFCLMVCPPHFLLSKTKLPGQYFDCEFLQFQEYSQNASLLNTVCKYTKHWMNFCKSLHHNTEPTHRCALKQAGHPNTAAYTSPWPSQIQLWPRARTAFLRWHKSQTKLPPLGKIYMICMDSATLHISHEKKK